MSDVFAYRLSDEQWARLEPMLPPPTTGRPSRPYRPLLDGMLWLLRTGAPWRAMPACFGKWHTVYSRFRRWRADGVLERVVAELVQLEAVSQPQAHRFVCVDSTVVRAHRAAAGASKTLDHKPLDAAEAGSAASCTSPATSRVGSSA